MIKFALKNLATKKIQALLIMLSVVLSAGTAVLAYNTATQVNEGITSTAAYYSAIVGPAGSATQLVMNTMYFTDSPLGTIPYAVVSELEQDMRVREAVPFAMADSYNGSPMVGTSPSFLESRKVADGVLFDAAGTFQVVVGANVARTNRLSVGDQIYTSHSVGEEHHTPFTVCGILEETHTVYDNVVFTQIRSIWEVHEEEEEHEHEHEEEHDHEDLDGMVCAVLVKTSSPTAAMSLVNDYKDRIFTERMGESYSLQAIEPMATVRGVLQEANNTKYVVYALCGIILAMNIMVISIITLLNMYHSAGEIALMRLIGIGMKKINAVYIIQNGVIGLCSVLLALLLSKACLSLIGGYVASMGVVLDPGKFYPLEAVILASVFVITVLPTVICTAVMARRDGLGE